MRVTGRLVAATLAVVATACSAQPTTTAPSPTVDLVAQPPPVQVDVARPDAPNIIVFMTDDQTLDQMAALPETQARIFDAGATFTQSFVNLPSCCPSRATFLTGQHAVNHGVLTNSGVSGGFANFDNQEATLATALKAAGYQTIFVGKYLNGFGLDDETRFTPPGWTDFRGLLAPTATLYHSPSLWVNDVLFTFGEQDYVTEVITRQVTDALGSAQRTNAPIFAWVSYPAPHAQAGAPVIGFDLKEFLQDQKDENTPRFLAPPIPAARHVDKLANEPLVITPNFNEADLSDKPDFLQRQIRSEAELEVARVFNQRGLESLLSVDESITEIMNLVQRQAGDRETWFLFTSDNGLLIGAHRQFGAKYYAYEESARVPLGIVGPGTEPGTLIAMPVSNIDLAPTIVDLAGATPPRPPDGISLIPYLTGKRQQHGRALLIEGFDLRPTSPPYRAVHTGDSIYIEWATGERELYDLRLDPYQLDNVIDGFVSRDLLERNVALLRELEDCAGDACHLIGQELPLPPNRP